MIFNELPFTPTFVYPILSDPRCHWSVNRVSFVYCSDLETEAVINFHHNDALICPTIDDLCLVDTLYSFPKIVDCGANGEVTEAFAAELIYWLDAGRKLDLTPGRLIRSYWSLDVENINDAIPMMLWIDHCRSICREVIRLPRLGDVLRQYNQFVMNLRRIERSGLRSIKNNIEYTQYDPYTLTGRPSNHFNGTNYAALTNQDRSNYVSRFVNGFLMNIDFRGFHLFLLYSILGLQFPIDIYDSLSKIYTDAGIENENSKSFTFRQIYGGIDARLIDISPFREIAQLSDLLFDQYKRGNLTTLLHGKSLQFKDDLTRPKLLSYMLQNLETEFNMELIDALVNMNLESKLILYTYDSFLFDVCPREARIFTERVKTIFDQIPHRMEIGRNYGDMKLIGQ